MSSRSLAVRRAAWEYLADQCVAMRIPVGACLRGDREALQWWRPDWRARVARNAADPTFGSILHAFDVARP